MRGQCLGLPRAAWSLGSQRGLSHASPGKEPLTPNSAFSRASQRISAETVFH